MNKPKKEDKYKLPVEVIKKDLFKTFIFGLFSLWVLLALYFAKFDYQSLLSLISRLRT